MCEMNISGADPKVIHGQMTRAIGMAKDLNFRLECRGMSDETELLREQTRSCYKTLADVENDIEIGRYNSGEVNPRVFSISAAMEDILCMVRSKTRRYTIEFDWEIERGVKCVADPERFAACLMNLIVNAFQNVDSEEGRIKVVLKRQGDYAFVSVVDDGYGMTAQQFEECISRSGNGGFEIMKRFCESVGTRHVIVTNEYDGMGISIKVPLKPDDMDESISLSSGESPEKVEAFPSASLLIYKLQDVIIDLNP